MSKKVVQTRTGKIIRSEVKTLSASDTKTVVRETVSLYKQATKRRDVHNIMERLSKA